MRGSTPSNITLCDADPRIAAVEVSLSALGISFTPPEVLSSKDLSVMGPPSAGRSGVAARAPRAASPPAGDPLMGRVVADRYRITGLLGRGGMGSVYQVEHTRIGKLLAMKLLSGELSQSADAARRFKREALTVSRLSSPNTVQVFDFGVSEGLTYLVMELVSGDNLGRLLRAEGPMHFSRVLRIVIQVSSSLAEAHQKGIVHRDVKPENIMLLGRGRGDDLVKVLDFGLAKLRDAGGLDDVTGKGIILGTPNYMAPEQIRDEEVDARTDVYAVGALMYRMLTGHPPFSAESPMAVLSKHLHELPVPPARRAPDRDIPAAVGRAVMRAMEKRPADRFPRIEELQAVLVEALRAAGSSSVESLLDPGALAADVATHREALATRDEVDAYERKLRRTRWGAAFTATALLAGAAGAALALVLPRAPRVSGSEIEPNNTGAEATPLSVGRPMIGQLGKRIDPTHGDRDFYGFDLPGAPAGEDSVVSIRVSALPNMAMCTVVYRAGFADPAGTYCVGRPGRDLVIPALRLAPGRYLVAVLQDLASHGGVAPHVHESISDAYTVRVDRAAPEPGVEIEPNDHVSAATLVTPGQALKAAIGWERDEDVFCAAPGFDRRFRWKVRAGIRDGGVLEATFVGAGEVTPMRIALDEVGTAPWQSGIVSGGAGAPRCLRVRLSGEPREAGARSGLGEPFVVEIEPL